MNSYELILLFDPNLGEEKIEEDVSKVENRIKSHGGEILKIEKWGSRRLASTIEKARKLKHAYYVILYFQSEPSLPGELQKYLKVSEKIIRYSLIRAEEKPLPEIEGTPLEEKVETEAFDVGEIKEESSAPPEAEAGEIGGES